MFENARKRAKTAAIHRVLGTDFKSKTCALVPFDGLDYAISVNSSLETAEEAFLPILCALAQTEVDFICDCGSCLAANDLEFKDCDIAYLKRFDYMLPFRLSQHLRDCLDKFERIGDMSEIQFPDDKLVTKYGLSMEEIIVEIHEYLSIDTQASAEELAKVREEAITFANDNFAFIDSIAFADESCNCFSDYVHLYSINDVSFVSMFLTAMASPEKDFTSCIRVYLYKKYIANKAKELYTHALEVSDHTVIDDVIYTYAGMSDFEHENVLTPDALLDEMRLLSRS